VARVLIRPEARTELQQIITYLIEKAGVEVAQRFRRSATETFQDLARMPESGSPSKVRRPEFVQVRMHRSRALRTT